MSWLSPLKGRTLVIIDTCYSGAAALDALVLLERSRGSRASDSQMQFIASALSVEEARPGWFMEGLREALDRVTATNRFDEWLPMEKILDSINRHLAIRSLELRLDSIRNQQAVLYRLREAEVERMLEAERKSRSGIQSSDQRARFSGSVEGLSVFFPNRGRLDFIPGMDHEQARRVLYSIQTDALKNHWDPRSRAVSGPADAGWYFSGRHSALAYLKRRVESGDACMLVISGMAGSGKSALLSRFVTLADEEQRRRAESAGALAGTPPEALPTPNAVDCAVYARARSTVSLAQEIAIATGGDLSVGDWDQEPAAALIDVLRRPGRKRTVLVVDALDEANDPPGTAVLLNRIAHAGCDILLLVGLRTDPSGSSDLLGVLGYGIEVVNLDDATYWSVEDLANFVERYLLTAAGSPYAARASDEEVAVREVAQVVASRAQRSFLVAVTTARALVGRPSLAREELKTLPTGVGDAFDLDLKRFSGWRQCVYVLGALAYGRGRGLPRSLWPEVVRALQPAAASSIPLWEHSAGFYVSRSQVDGEIVCRLYHDEFARHLREKLEAEGARCSNELCPHTSPRACAAMALLEAARSNRSQGLSPHLLDHLVSYLAEANLADKVYELVTADWWQNARSEVDHDPTHSLSDLSTAVDLASREPQDLEMIVRLCALSSRLITPPGFISDAASTTASIEAPPVVIETLARAGQQGRARLLADNVLSPLDRCVAFARLAHVYCECGSRDEALACAKEAKRSAFSVGPGFRAMAYFWVVRATHAIGDERRARAAADEALSSVSAAAAPYSMSPLNDALWAGLCLRLLRDRAGLDRIRKCVDEQSMSTQFLNGMTNLRLQAACASGDCAYLKKVISHRTKENKNVDDAYRYEPHPFPGNLEFALVDAGMIREFESLERTLRSQKRWPASNPKLLHRDAGKRFVWALARLGRFTEALDLLSHVDDLEERARAVYRISKCAIGSLTPDLQRQLVTAAERVLLEAAPAVKPGKHAAAGRKASPQTKRSANRSIPLSDRDAWRIFSWLAPVFLTGGDRPRAIDLCDRVCASGYVASPDTSLCLPVPATMRVKSHVDLRLDPTDDEMMLAQIHDALARTDPATADQMLTSITSPRVRARAASAIAARHPDPKRARALVIEAMKNASRCGEGELKKVLVSAQIPYPTS